MVVRINKSWELPEIWFSEAKEGVCFEKKRDKERVAINISGLRFETFKSTLARFPDTLLGCPSKRARYFDACRQEYFFNRNRRVFDAILFYYQSWGRISRPENVTEKQFVSELSFFEIGKKEDFLTFSQRVDRAILAESDKLPTNKYQRYLWKLFSASSSTFVERLITFICILTLALSIILTCVESLPSIMFPKSKSNFAIKNVIYLLNVVCYIWFTVEIISRAASCASKIQFLKSPMNWIDVVAILPFYLQLFIESQAKITSLSILRALRIFRIARIFKISRYSRGMRSLIYTLYASRHELNLLFFILLISTILSAGLTYYAEINAEGASLKSIPEALWWSINTITTVGYGDSYPITTLGKFLGGFFSVFGTLLIGLPIFCLVSNFLELWDSIRDTEDVDSNTENNSVSSNVSAKANYVQMESILKYGEGEGNKNENTECRTGGMAQNVKQVEEEKSK